MGRPHILQDVSPIYYYILYRAATLKDPFLVDSLVRGGVSMADLEFDAMGQDIAFFRLGRSPVSMPSDVDGDGIDDVYELERMPLLNPANPNDAALDPDGDGRSHLIEYLHAVVPTVKLASSPARGEAGVAITRETILRFSASLAGGNTISPNDFHATFGGRRILSRIELSSDRRKATLFYLEPLPGSARVRVTFNGDAYVDALGRKIDADGDGVPGGKAIIDFDTLSITPVIGTAVIGQVFASEPMQGQQAGTFADRPLEGVRVSVDGMEESIFAVTDDQGRFTLNNTPAGRFFVHIDGRTAMGSQWPGGNYYPAVGKAWEAMAGRADNLAGETGTIYLPLITSGTLLTVSPSQPTTVAFPQAVLDNNPALQGVSVTIPANALFSDDGTRGGMVGMAPVAPDRLPEALPEGLDFPLVITIQTDGAGNFDQPVPVKFPNLPDPVSGETLPPGAKSALWSFDHDLGRWVVQGPMTVTEDGLYLCSDAGYGVRQPGWHGAAAGSGGGGGPEWGGPGGGGGGGEEDPKCPGLSGWQQVELIFNVAKEVAECAAGLAGAQKGLKCLLDASRAVGSFSFAVKKLYGDATSDPPAGTLDSLRSSVAVLKESAGSLTTLIDCVEGQSPVGKLEAVVVCAGNVLGIAQQVCGALNPDPNAPPKCQPSPTVKEVCQGVDNAKAIQTSVLNLLQIAQTAQEKLLQAGINAALNQLDATLTQIAANQPPVGTQGRGPAGPAPDRALTAAEWAQVVTALGPVVAATAELEAGAAPAESLNEHINALEAQVLAVQRLAHKGVRESGSPVERRFFYSIEINGQIQRGVTSRLGTYDIRLTPDAYYHLAQYDPMKNTYGQVTGKTSGNGEQTDLLPVLLASVDGAPDTDNDGLADVAENVIGTSPTLADTDEDGVSDLAEVQQGSNPLDNRPVVSGVIAAASAEGEVLDVCALNDLVVTANGEAGIVVFNVSDGPNPVRTAVVNTPGFASRVACSGNRIAVADSASLIIIDITDPPAARIVHDISLGIGAVNSVATFGGLAFAGGASGAVVAVDMTSGGVLNRFEGAAGVTDLAVGGDNLYILESGGLRAASFSGGNFAAVGHVASPGSGQRKRLFVGGDRAYVTFGRGYNVFDVSVPAAPALLLSNETGQFGWRQMVPNGSGLGIAATGPNSTSDGPHDISLYDLGAAGDGTAFITTLPTPGLANAVSIYNGLAYVADNDSLQVVNYRAFDTAGMAPTIALTASFSLAPAEVEEGTLQRVSALVMDDIQVRNVEFYLDGIKVLTDGNFPFEYRFLTPGITEGKTGFTLRAKATDTGGNSVWSEEVTVTLLPETTPPQVTRTIPDLSHSGVVTVLGVFFNEPILSASLDPASWEIRHTGPDLQFDTADDVLEPLGVLDYRLELDVVFMNIAAALPPGSYRATVRPPLSDLNGNLLAEPVSWQFNAQGLTTLSGIVQKPGGSPAVGARVIIVENGMSALTGNDGRYAIPNILLVGGEAPIHLALQYVEAGNQYFATVENITLTHGVTDGGTVTLIPSPVVQRLARQAAGFGFTLALRSDGSLWSWGGNQYGELGTGGTEFQPYPVRVGDDSTWKVLAAGYHHALALKTDGSLWSWGQNNEGQLGDGTRSDSYQPFQVGTDTDWFAVDAGVHLSLGIKNDGTLWLWGGPSGLLEPTQIGDESDWAAVAASRPAVVLLKSNGSLWTMSAFGGIPTPMGTDTDWKTIAWGNYHTLALKLDGSLWAWGNNFEGQLGIGTTDGEVLEPVRVGSDNDWTAVDGGWIHSLALKADRSVWSWGGNDNGQLIDRTRPSTLTPLRLLPPGSAEDIVAGNDQSLIVTSEGILLGWGSVISTAIPQRLGFDTEWETPFAAGASIWAIGTDGALRAWGDNQFGQLGDGSMDERAMPVAIGSDTDWKTVFPVASDYDATHVLAIRNDGGLWSWGRNAGGQLGLGSSQDSSVPMRVGSANDWATAAAGPRRALAIRTDGSLWGWGSLNFQNTPTRVGADSDWRTIACGGSHQVGIKLNGSLWSWGGNEFGQLGNGGTDPVVNPAPIGADTDWVAVGAGANHTVALKSDGSLWAWGGNFRGELGLGLESFSESTPMRIGGDTDWAAFAVGDSHTLALKANGSLWAWGNNASGQLGDGSGGAQGSPIRVGSESDWASMSAGSANSAAIKNDGSFFVWGSLHAPQQLGVPLIFKAPGNDWR